MEEGDQRGDVVVPLCGVGPGQHGQASVGTVGGEHRRAAGLEAFRGRGEGQVTRIEGEGVLLAPPPRQQRVDGGELAASYVRCGGQVRDSEHQVIVESR